MVSRGFRSFLGRRARPPVRLLLETSCEAANTSPGPNRGRGPRHAPRARLLLSPQSPRGPRPPGPRRPPAIQQGRTAKQGAVHADTPLAASFLENAANPRYLDFGLNRLISRGRSQELEGASHRCARNQQAPGPRDPAAPNTQPYSPPGFATLTWIPGLALQLSPRPRARIPFSPSFPEFFTCRNQARSCGLGRHSRALPATSGLVAPASRQLPGLTPSILRPASWAAGRPSPTPLRNPIRGIRQQERGGAASPVPRDRKPRFQAPSPACERGPRPSATLPIAQTVI